MASKKLQRKSSKKPLHGFRPNGSGKERKKSPGNQIHGKQKAAGNHTDAEVRKQAVLDNPSGIQKPKALQAERMREYVRTGIEGLDRLFENGIPRGVSVLIAGGAGSGKTIMCLQMLANACKRGEKCLYMSFEESEGRLREHMEDFGWNVHEFEKDNILMIKRFSLFDIARSIDALLEKAKGELLIDVNPVILPDDFRPQWVVIDSLTAIASAFSKKGDTYRSYIEQLFRHFEKLKVNAFFISETKEIPSLFSTSGVEEFLADGVIVLYNIRRGNMRESAIEVLKMRGAKHMKRIVAMQITGKKGIEIFPEQEVFSDMG